MPWFAQLSSLSSDKILALLQRELPLCFSNKPKPLACNIKKALLGYYQQETRFSPQALLTTLQHYITSTEYLETLILGATRVDIYGHGVGIVTEQEAKQAKVLLSLEQKLIHPMGARSSSQFSSSESSMMSA